MKQVVIGSASASNSLGVQHIGRAAVMAHRDGHGEVPGVAEAADRAGVEVGVETRYQSLLDSSSM